MDKRMIVHQNACVGKGTRGHDAGGDLLGDCKRGIG